MWLQNFGRYEEFECIPEEGNPNYTIIRFNSWDVIEKEFLIKNLFDEIKFTLNTINPSFKETFKTYSQKIVPPVFKTISYVYSLAQGLDPQTAKVISDGTEHLSQNLLNDNEENPISNLKKSCPKN